MQLESSLISLGTAKLGNHNYGFSSKSLSIDLDENKFLENAFNIGIKNIDTSPRYGKAQEILGKFIKKTNHSFLISSKVDELSPRDKKSTLKVVDQVKRSLDVLNIENLDICYLHQNELEIISDEYIIEGLMILKNNNYINSIGASVYNHDEFEYALKSDFFDVIQCPINATNLSFYTRFIEEKSSKKIIARSIFLQGLLLNYENDYVKNISKEMLNYFDYLNTLAIKLSITRYDLVKSLIFSLNNIHQIILGTDSIANLKENIKMTKLDIHDDLFLELFQKANKFKWWSNPRNWIR